MRSYFAIIVGLENRVVARVSTVEELANEWRPDLQFLIPIFSDFERDQFSNLFDSGLSNLIVLTENTQISDCERIVYCESAFDVKSSDVVILDPTGSRLSVAMRGSDQHHTVFLTNRCNSNCIMCSQPPTNGQDDWLVDEAIQISVHMDYSPKVVGLTGGEPLLLGVNIRPVLDAFRAISNNDVSFDLLTNGRLINAPEIVGSVLMERPRDITWMVPLYGHAETYHDFVVQSHGAFNETLDGLLTLHAHEQRIQLRMVLIEPVLENLENTIEFIARNLPFVDEVALMGCEPIGFALANPNHCRVDLMKWVDRLADTVEHLVRNSIRPVIMNVPLCVIPEHLWRFAHRSISDWKQTYVDECDDCAVKDSCSGLFEWAATEWRPAKLHPIVFV